MGGTGRPARGLAGKLFWFALLWVAGVASVAAVAYGIRLILAP
jgi:hypothetical protein